MLGSQEDGQVEDLLVTYASGAGGIFADCRLVNESVAAAVVGVDGEQLTAMTFAAEQYRQIKATGEPTSGHARITALGVSVEVYADADAFAAAPGSLLVPAADPADDNPPRVAAESFFSYGAFSEASVIGWELRLMHGCLASS